MIVQPKVMVVYPALYAVLDLGPTLPLGMVFSQFLNEQLQDAGQLPALNFQIAVTNGSETLLMGFTASSYAALAQDMDELPVEDGKTMLLPLKAIQEDDDFFYLHLDGVVDGPVHLMALCSSGNGAFRPQPGDVMAGLTVLDCRLAAEDAEDDSSDKRILA